MTEDISFESFKKQLEEELKQEFGHLICNQDLSLLLGFSNIGSFRQALKRGQIPVPIFTLENKRGKYALTKDIALYLAERRFLAISSNKH